VFSQRCERICQKLLAPVLTDYDDPPWTRIATW
jgi:hypothetical protein